MDSKQIVVKLNKIKELPTLPVIAMEVNRMLDDYNTSIEGLSKVIEKDQAITSKLLRLVNSSFFGVRSKVSTASDAVVLLGFDAVRNIVVSISIVKSLSGNLKKSGIKITEFWQHSINVGMTSKHLSEMTKKEEPEACFTAGLLHDIGKIVMSQHFPTLFEEIVESSIKEKTSFRAAEKKVTQVGHDKMGGFLSEKWKLPVNLVDAVKFHHTVSPRSSNINIVKIVHTANIIANTIPLKSEFADEDAAKKILSGMDKNTAREFLPQIKEVSYWYLKLKAHINDACKFFIEDE